MINKISMPVYTTNNNVSFKMNREEAGNTVILSLGNESLSAIGEKIIKKENPAIMHLFLDKKEGKDNEYKFKAPKEVAKIAIDFWIKCLGAPKRMENYQNQFGIKIKEDGKADYSDKFVFDYTCAFKKMECNEIEASFLPLLRGLQEICAEKN